jgi:periplasmic divalent cation tolerance protein
MELSRAAVESRLAAGAQVTGPVASMYWWDGGLERSEEWLVLLKLPADRYDELAAFITERHSYDEPEIVALPIVAGAPAYLDWMREETRPTEEAPAEEAPAEEAPAEEAPAEEAPAEDALGRGGGNTVPGGTIQRAGCSV